MRHARHLTLALTLLLLALAVPPTGAAAAGPPRPERIFVIVYDNTHPEDLAAMPHLQAFLQQAATARWHTVLVSHTAPDYVSLASGYYPRHTGVLDNSYQAGGKSATWRFWETPQVDGRPSVLVPPFWTLFNQAGRDVGVIGWGDSVLESAGDVKLQMQQHPEYFPAGTGGDPGDYEGYAAFYHDGRRAYGAPSLPWLYGLVGPLRQWADLQTPLALKATLAMQQHGLTVTYTYIESVHAGRDRGGYADRLQAADAAWADFFAQLRAMGVGPENSLFVLGADEGDHYNPGGTLGASLPAWLADNPGARLPEGSVLSTGSGNSLLYLPRAENLPALQRALAAIPGWRYALGPEAMALSQAAAPGDGRTPALILLPEPDRTFTNGPGRKSWEPIRGLYWNHGTVDPAINEVFFYLAGPGVKAGESGAWADHTDLLPTLAYALGLPVPAGDGRPLFELWAAAPAGAADLQQLAAAFKQVSSPLGPLGLAGLELSGTLLRLDAAGSPQAAELHREFADLVTARDDLAQRLRAEIAADLEHGRAPAPAAVQTLSGETAALQQRLADLQQRAQAALAAAPGSPAGGPVPPRHEPPSPGSWQYIAAVVGMGAILWWMQRRRRL